MPTKDIMNVRDIPGAVGRKLTKTRNLGIFEADPNQDPTLLPKGYKAGHSSTYDYFNYDDVHRSSTFKAKRSTNPMHPTYKVIDGNNQPYEIGKIAMNHVGSAQTQPPLRKDDCEYPKGAGVGLNVSDIYGTSTGSAWDGNFVTRKRTQFQRTNETSDIFGANAGSLYARRSSFAGNKYAGEAAMAKIYPNEYSKVEATPDLTHPITGVGQQHGQALMENSQNSGPKMRNEIRSNVVL